MPQKPGPVWREASFPRLPVSVWGAQPCPGACVGLRLPTWAEMGPGSSEGPPLGKAGVLPTSTGMMDLWRRRRYHSDLTAQLTALPSASKSCSHFSSLEKSNETAREEKQSACALLWSVCVSRPTIPMLKPYPSDVVVLGLEA